MFDGSRLLSKRRAWWMFDCDGQREAIRFARVGVDAQPKEHSFLTRKWKKKKKPYDWMLFRLKLVLFADRIHFDWFESSSFVGIGRRAGTLGQSLFHWVDLHSRIWSSKWQTRPSVNRDFRRNRILMETKRRTWPNRSSHPQTGSIVFWSPCRVSAVYDRVPFQRPFVSSIHFNKNR